MKRCEKCNKVIWFWQNWYESFKSDIEVKDDTTICRSIDTFICEKCGDKNES